MGPLTAFRTWLIVALICAMGWIVIQGLPAGATSTNSDSSRTPQTPAVFSPAHGSTWAAVTDFLNRRPTHPAQPIAFPHNVHLARGLQCESCHTGVDQGPDAALPSVKFCMSCHLVIAKDRPEIRKMAAYQARGEDVPWVRVYNYSISAHVRFNHAPHIRADVACSSCHGNLQQQTTAVRALDLNMGYCLSCHQQRKASVDCTTCHY